MDAGKKSRKEHPIGSWLLATRGAVVAEMEDEMGPVVRVVNPVRVKDRVPSGFELDSKLHRMSGDDDLMR